MKIVDTFLFFNELDLLEIRLNSLAPFVDRFVLCESPLTHTGKVKPLYYSQNKDRYKGFNITHLVVDNYDQFAEPLQREGNQRNFIINGIKDEDPETMILLSDVDEIPHLRHYATDGGGEGFFAQQLFRYALNLRSNQPWLGTIAVQRKNITGPLDSLRDQIARQAMGKKPRMKMVVKHGGWHFNSLGTPGQIIEKIEALCAQRYNKPKIKASLKENVVALKDIYKGGELTVQMPSGPRWLRHHIHEYKHLTYGTRVWRKIWRA